MIKFFKHLKIYLIKETNELIAPKVIQLGHYTRPLRQQDIAILAKIEEGLAHSRSSTPTPREITVDGWILRRGAEDELWVPEKRSWRNLPDTPASIMEILMINATRPVHLNDIHAFVEQFKNITGPNHVRAHISHLRQATEVFPRRPRHIITHRNTGCYSFQPNTS